MKYVWEATDIEPGVCYSRKDISEVHMFGYLAAREDRCLVSISLEDGAVQPPKAAEAWAAMLTREGYEPAQRPKLKSTGRIALKIWNTPGLPSKI